MSIGVVQGPLSYQQGGFSVTPTQVALTNFDGAEALGGSFNSTATGGYKVQVLMPTSYAPPVANNTVSGNPPRVSAVSSVNLRFTAANGTEVANNTNLTSEFVNVAFFGG
jgi:hypothetical protein